MLTGLDLGQAIEAARVKKGITKKALAEVFRVAAPSVQGWVTTGRIDKSKLIDVIRFFSDVVGPEHWGLDDGDLIFASYPAIDPALEPEPETAADAVLRMLAKHGKNLPPEARQKIANAVSDSPPSGGSSNVIHGDFSRSTVVKGDTIVIAQYDVRAAMGAGGQVPADYREFVRNVVVDRIQLDDLGIKYTAPENLKIISGWGQSMLGTIEDKSPLLVDIGVTDWADDGVYVFTWLQHLYIKRVQVLDAEHFLLVSDNKAFEPQKARMEDMHFQARVLGVWNFRKL
ncbi:S24 family peptidase [Pseudomonas sp. NY15437]|uniref:S24 family peptidase n=1 Tax=Pseudomonas sp. NY15437 TaxID=3400360 RepID=UPI003A86430F